jgi:hypothetical protein
VIFELDAFKKGEDLGGRAPKSSENFLLYAHDQLAFRLEQMPMVDFYLDSLGLELWDGKTCAEFSERAWDRYKRDLDIPEGYSSVLRSLNKTSMDLRDRGPSLSLAAAWRRHATRSMGDVPKCSHL